MFLMELHVGHLMTQIPTFEDGYQNTLPGSFSAESVNVAAVRSVLSRKAHVLSRCTRDTPDDDRMTDTAANGSAFRLPASVVSMS